MSDPANGFLPLDSSPQPTSAVARRTVLPLFAAAMTLIAVAWVAWLAGRHSAKASTADREASARDWHAGLAAMGIQTPTLQATSAVTSEKFSMATGSVSDQADGIFLLDHNSGLLQCRVLYPRVGQFLATFTTNVSDALGSGGKGGEYLMLTGRADFPRSTAQPAAATCVYVMDSATGNYACYGIPFNHGRANSKQQQSGALVLITTGTANPLVDRDSIR